MITDWEFLLSVITVLIAVIAVTQTNRQIKLSNKQHLFDKRMESYLIAISLINLYRSNSPTLNTEDDEPIFNADLYFLWLTNNTYLAEITTVIDEPLNEKKHREFLIKLEELREVATKIKLLFPDKTAHNLGDFVFNYQALLLELYKYKMILNKMNEVNKNNTLTLEEAQKQIGEKEHRKRLEVTFNKLNEVEVLLQNTDFERKIIKQIKLY